MSHSHGSVGSITSTAFGKTTDGRTVDIYTLRNANGMEARITNYGGIVVSLTAPDRDGRFGDVVLGYDNLEGYLKFSPYFGALVGRYANRIGEAKFTLNGKTYVLAKNNGSHSLHGGVIGFDKVVWNTKVLESPMGPALELTYLSRDGDEGFPGNLKVKAVHTLTNENALRIDFSATTDAPTLCNLTHHSYFNLAGKGDILKHELYINASRFTPVDASLVPTGELKPVDGTPFDFRKSMIIGSRIHNDDPQLKFAGGYDQNFVVDNPPGQLGLHARAYEPTTGRVMEVLSTEPGIQFYTSNHLDGSALGKGGQTYQRFAALCLEPHHFPDSPNKPNFPSAVLHPDQTYRNIIIYKFSTRMQ
ncbi:MAG TPA: aldose epimerase family protein [Candidatus Saccharimonadales bacterium]|nr:aldose epimerase family protein [Candidatus Saccharimonadales bacterium]